MSDRPVRVVHLVTLLELGGAQGNTIHTVENLDPARFEAHLWCGRGAYWDHEMEQRLGTRGRLRFFPRLVRPIRPLLDVLAIVDLYRAFREFKPDIVHTHSSKAGILGRIAARLAGVPVIVHTFHGFGFNDRQRRPVRALFLALERICARYCRRLIFVSNANMAEARQKRIGDQARYALIRSGVPIAGIRAAGEGDRGQRAIEAVGIPADAEVVTTVSAFKPQKNLDDFIDVAASLAALRPSTFFLIIGDGSERARLEALVERKGLKGRLMMPGWMKNVPDLLAGSKIFALTSLWEGLPRALVEAMILGIPAVCYDTDGVRDLLSAGGGVLVRKTDCAGMAKSIEGLLENAPLWRRVSDEARGLVGREFDIDEMVRQQERLYAAIISEKHE